jgi:SAM-dependent methyltransferase
MAWYEEWFGLDYLELYAHRDADEAERHAEFVRGLVGSAPGRVLDLACGAGRHLAALRRRDIAAVGIDLSLPLLALAERLPRSRGDMRALPFGGGTFDWVLNFFTSFGYFATERENFRVLEELVRVLRPGGGFLMDLLNRDRAIAALVPSQTQELGGRPIAIERWFDARTQRLEKRMAWNEDGEERRYSESVRAYRREEVEIGMQWAGLEVTAVYGGFDGGLWTPESERLILVGRRA